MSCGGVSELMIDRRAGGGSGGGVGGVSTNTVGGGSGGGCRLRGSSSNATSTTAPANAKGAPATGAPTQPGPLRPTKPCCFCWCCCCSCSCLAVKNVDENGPTKNLNNSDLLNCDGEPPPTLDEIRSWGKSFDKLMKSSAGRKVFRDFLRCEYSEENILFWLACEELKRETNPDVIEEKARKIYEDYISILSPKEVSLDSRVREIVNRNMVEPTPHTFDEAQLQIYTLMHRDSYPRFVNSSLFKTLAQLNSGTASDTASGGGGDCASDTQAQTQTYTNADSSTTIITTTTTSTTTTITTATQQHQQQLQQQAQTSPILPLIQTKPVADDTNGS